MTSRPNNQNAADILEARGRSRVNVATIRDLLHGGRDAWEEHDKMASLLSQDPAFDKSDRPYLTRTERYERTLKTAHRLQELNDHYSWSEQEHAKARWFIMKDEPSAFELHEIAFAPVFLSQASPEIAAKYRDLVVNKGIIGCYLQTELGHGSNVASLETTATYIPETREFEINSPTLTSRKWWVGGLARTATHGVVQAQLILPGGKSLGPHLFFVQLRSLEDHGVLPGITLGDVGPKVLNGYTGVDNGFASFDHVRIPREHLLSRFAQVTESGQYIQPPHAKMSYAGMVSTRAQISARGGWTTAKAITIAIRYATVRRQGNRGPDGLERQIITYPSVYNRLLPILARSYTFILLGQSMGKMFTEMSAKLSAGDTSILAEMHTITSGLKALTTNHSTQDIEVARRTLGGHGFSAFSDLGRIYADNLPSATFEGDNYILDQQVTRAAAKAYRLFAASNLASDLTPSTSYLRLLKGDVPPLAASEKSWASPPGLVSLLERRAACVVRHYVEHIENPDASAEQRVARAVSEAFVAVQILAFIHALSRSESIVVIDVLTLYLLTTAESALVDLHQFGLLSTITSGVDPTSDLREAVKDLCLKVLPNAIGLTDAFGFSDWELNSALGVSDGHVYEALWEKAQTEPLNNTELPPGYNEHLKPILRRGQRLAARNGPKL